MYTGVCAVRALVGAGCNVGRARTRASHVQQAAECWRNAVYTFIARPFQGTEFMAVHASLPVSSNCEATAAW